jgi:hypothetical protein
MLRLGSSIFDVVPYIYNVRKYIVNVRSSIKNVSSSLNIFDVNADRFIM